VRIPEDMSVGAFDNSEWLGIWRPPITAVDVAIEEIARLAVELLVRRIGVPSAERGAGGDKPVTYTLSTALIVRGSCQPPRAF
jgi:DNA-binding LacI/PurR family transcriptional regulator